jgi:hypothetical protein
MSSQQLIYEGFERKKKTKAEPVPLVSEAPEPDDTERHIQRLRK